MNMPDLEALRRELLAFPGVKEATVESVTYIEVEVVVSSQEARRAWYGKEQELYEKYPDLGFSFRARVEEVKP